MRARSLRRLALPGIILGVFFMVEATTYIFDVGLGNATCLATPLVAAALVWLALDASPLKGPIACCIAGCLLGAAFAYANFFFARWSMMQLGHVDQSWGLTALFNVLIMASWIGSAVTGFVSAVTRYQPAD